MFKQRSKLLFITAILSAAYAIYLIVYVYQANGSSGDSAEQIGIAIGTVLLLPHIVTVGIGTVFYWLGFGLKVTWGILVGAILFSVATLFMPIYFMFTVPILIFGFIAFANQRKILNGESPDKSN